MTTLQEKIAVMQAHANGKAIELQHRDDTLNEWHPTIEPCWNWHLFEYRVAKTKYTQYGVILPVVFSGDMSCRLFKNKLVAEAHAKGHPVATVTWET